MSNDYASFVTSLTKKELNFVDELINGKAGKDAVCCWNQDDVDSDLWDTDCKNIFILVEGGPEENRMRYCCYCGKPISVVRWEDRGA